MWVAGLLLVLAAYGIVLLLIAAVQFLAAHWWIVVLAAVVCLPFFFIIAALQRNAYRNNSLTAVAEDHARDMHRLHKASKEAKRNMDRIVDEGLR